MKILESDLDNAEEKVANTLAKYNASEAHAEELERENKQFQHQIKVLEGMCVYAYACVCTRVCVRVHHYKVLQLPP